MSSNINRKILYVEDDPTNQVIVKNFLQSFGYSDVTCVDNANEALTFLENEKVDIILMDLGLPGGINGIVLTEKIRKSTLSSKDVPIIAITGNGEKKAREDCFAAGMNDFLTKPLDKSALEAALKKLKFSP